MFALITPVTHTAAILMLSALVLFWSVVLVRLVIQLVIRPSLPIVRKALPPVRRALTRVMHAWFEKCADQWAFYAETMPEWRKRTQHEDGLIGLVSWVIYRAGAFGAACNIRAFDLADQLLRPLTYSADYLSRTR
jgi:hypothetical protein